MKYSVDTMISVQEGSTAVSQDASALDHVWHTRGYSRFIYGVYAILGVIFFGIGIYVALGVLIFFLDAGIILTSGTALLICYALLNSIIGYGFILHRKWLIVLFSSVLILKVLLALTSLIASHELMLPVSLFIVAGALLFLSLTRHLLSGRYFAPRTIVPIEALLLFSFFLANIGMLN